MESDKKGDVSHINQLELGRSDFIEFVVHDPFAQTCMRIPSWNNLPRNANLNKTLT